MSFGSFQLQVVCIIIFFDKLLLIRHFMTSEIDLIRAKLTTIRKFRKQYFQIIITELTVNTKAQTYFLRYCNC